MERPLKAESSGSIPDDATKRFDSFRYLAGGSPHPTSCTMREFAMAANHEKTCKGSVDDPKNQSGPRDVKIDRTAPAGSENSLGAQSVRDGRPATDDSVVEAMDEEGPGISPIEPAKKGR
jgi:hypothetical protein